MASVDLRGRDLLKEIDYTAEELTALLDVATVLKRAGEPKHISDAVIALVRNDYITGALLPVDGGRSLA